MNSKPRPQLDFSEYDSCDSSGTDDNRDDRGKRQRQPQRSDNVTKPNETERPRKRVRFASDADIVTVKNLPASATSATAASSATASTSASEGTENHDASNGVIANDNNNLNIELELEQFESEVAELAPQPSSTEAVQEDTDQEEEDQYNTAQQDETDMNELDEEEEQRELNDQIANLRQRLQQKTK